MTYLVALPGPTIREYPHVTVSEAQQIWAEAKSSRVWCFIKTLWFTGLQISKVLRLKAEGLTINAILGSKVEVTTSRINIAWLAG